MTQLTPRTPDRRAVRISIVLGAVIAVLILAAGIAFALVRPPASTAEAMAVVLPAKGLDEATSASQFETLSRGQIPATFAEVAGNLRFQTAAADQLGLSAAERQQVQVEATVVPNTSVILIRVTAPDPAVAEKMADAITTLSSQYLSGVLQPYRTETVQSAQGTAETSGLTPAVLIAASVVVALVAGVAAQQAVYHLLLVLRRGPAVGVPGQPSAGTPEPRRAEAAESDADGSGPRHPGPDGSAAAPTPATAP